PFPLFRFWGPTAGAESSEWIARCAEIVFERRQPTLTLVYLPHLDYNLQRRGPSWPGIAADLAVLDSLVGRLADAARAGGARVVVLSEYGISDVSGPVHINRVLREKGFLKVHRQLDWEVLDCGASRAFAVADHQAAHVYVRDADDIEAVRSALASLDGVAEVLDGAGKTAAGLDHPRSGELVALSAPDRWFTYYFWLDDDRAPPYARTVDIHEKPGYDPVELFLDPDMWLPALRIGARLVARKLGFRVDMDMIPLDASLVKGSHGAKPIGPERGAIIILPKGARMDSADSIRPTDVRDILLGLIFG
ncbi:MAG: alkaline phosphatase family protein, partial [Planctomycetota bacterium]|nr:alkaline phosphatase family protein [Planctomycetota bacterium]